MAISLIFVDLPAEHPDEAAAFYAGVMGWETQGRPNGIFHQIVPGGEFPLPDGSASGVEHLHLGIYSTREPRPDPNAPAEPLASGTATPRVYLNVDSRTEQDRVLSTAEERGATVLWRDKFWREFAGWHGSFRDPWGTQIILWTEASDDDPEIPSDVPY